MSDRVISTKRLPTCVITEVGSSGVGIGTYYPIGLTYDELLYFYWVPNWNQGTFSVDSSANSSVYEVTASISISEINTSGYKLEIDGSPLTITRERKLVCSGIYSEYINNAYQINYSVNGSSVEVNINSRILFSFNHITYYNGSYYPFVICEISGGDNIIDVPLERNYSNFDFSFSSLNTPSVDYDLTIPLTLFGKTINISGFLNDVGYGTGYGYTLPTSMSLVPTSYWPYASTNNTPIYNTSTGAQLQSPFA